MDNPLRLIWFFDHFNPYFQIGYAVLLVFWALFCFWSVSRRPTPGIILLGVVCVVAIVQTSLFVLSAFQEGRPFLPFLSVELRKHAYLYGRLLGPPSASLFGVTVIVLALENIRRKT